MIEGGRVKKREREREGDAWSFRKLDSTTRLVPRSKTVALHLKHLSISQIVLTLFPSLPPIALHLHDLPTLLLLPLLLAPSDPGVLDLLRYQIALGENEDDFLARLEGGDEVLEGRREVKGWATDVDENEEDRRHLGCAPELAVDLEVSFEEC